MRYYFPSAYLSPKAYRLVGPKLPIPCCRSAGHSLLELVMAVFLLYMAAVYLLGMFASGCRYSARNREQAATTYLARTHIERLLAQSSESLLNTLTGPCAAPYQEYKWRAQGSQYNSELMLIEVTVTSPAKASTTLRTFKPLVCFYGLDCDWAANQVVYAKAKSLSFHWLDDLKLGSTVSINDIGQGTGSSNYPLDVVGSPALGFTWSIRRGRNAVDYTRYSRLGQATGAGKSYSPQPASGVKPPLFCSLVGDHYASRVFAADFNNCGIWLLDDSKRPGQAIWHGNSPLKPSTKPIGRLGGMAIDDKASQLWLVDTQNDTLRQLLLGPARVRPGLDYEYAPNVGWWSAPVSLPYPVNGLAGVAVSSWASSVFAVDRNCLYCLAYVANHNNQLVQSWTKHILPDDLVVDGPSGIKCDRYSNVVFINTRRGSVWKYTKAGNTFVKLS